MTTTTNIIGCRNALAASVLGLTVTLSGTAYVVRSSADLLLQVPSAPFFFVGQWTTDFDAAMARGVDAHTVLCRLLVAPIANDRIGSQLLNTFMAADGASSVRAAIATAIAGKLGGNCQAARVLSIDNYATYSVGEAQFIGAQFRISIW